VTTEAPKNTERILFLLEIERAERPPHGLTTTEGGQTTSLCNFCGLTTMEGSQTANFCIAHGLTANEVDQTASTSNSQILNLNVVIITLMVWPQIALWSDPEVCRIFLTTSF
jgi:hypothetical protein